MSRKGTGFLLIAAAVVAAACSNSTGSSPFDGPSPLDGASACPQTLAAYCPPSDRPAGAFGVHCPATLAAAEADTGLCVPALDTEATCGTLTVIMVGGLDTSDRYYYDASGALIAITNDVTGQERCLAGAGTFAIPHAACTDTHPLAACDRAAGAGG